MPEEIYDPRERLEIFLNAVRTGDVEGLPDPQTREEMYLAAIAAKSALPDPTDASVGDALVLDADKAPTWGAVNSGVTKYIHICNFGKAIDSAVAMGMIIYIDETETPNVTNFLVNNNHRGTSNPYYGIYGYHNTAELFSVYYSSSKINFEKRTTSGTISLTGDTEENLHFNYVTYKIKGE